MRIFIGIILTVIGYLFVWKSEWLLNNFGRIAWAEKKLGTEGGSRLFYKLLGITIMFLGFFYATGVTDEILENIFGRAFK